MGNKVATFSEQQLEDYQDATFFTRKDILRVYGKFRELSPEVIPATFSEEQSRGIRLPCNTIISLAELKENPLKERICKVFSSSGAGDLSFEEFLDLLSSFSEKVPRDLKLHYAFKIYDFDDDGYIGTRDLEEVIERVTEKTLTSEEILQIRDKVLEEADVDCDGKLSFVEFNHVVARAPDFLSTFHIRM